MIRCFKVHYRNQAHFCLPGWERDEFEYYQLQQFDKNTNSWKPIQIVEQDIWNRELTIRIPQTIDDN